MSYTKTIMCLANSLKLGGRCVAGREMRGGAVGPWVRPVSKQPGGELSEMDRCYSGGIEPILGDIIEIPFQAPQKKSYQTENHVIDKNKYWKKIGRAKWEDICLAIENDKGDIWINGGFSRHGLNDKIDVGSISGVFSSLRLIYPERVLLKVQVENAAFNGGNLKCRAYFNFFGTNYAFTVTDPVVQAQYVAAGVGEHDLGRVLLCLSLSEPLKGFVYKLVAAIFCQARFERAV